VRGWFRLESCEGNENEISERSVELMVDISEHYACGRDS